MVTIGTRQKQVALIYVPSQEEQEIIITWFADNPDLTPLTLPIGWVGEFEKETGRTIPINEDIINSFDEIEFYFD